MSSSFFRVSTANMYDSSVRNLSTRQKTLVDLQENLTSGKRVVRPSDDPVAAAQAERALTRISRIQTEQRALEVQRNAITQAETTLGDAIGQIYIKQYFPASSKAKVEGMVQNILAIQKYVVSTQLIVQRLLKLIKNCISIVRKASLVQD